MSVSLYGDVQKEVIQATLADDFGIAVTFRETTTIYIERVVGTGEAVDILHSATNPFLATVGLRVEPAPPGSGIDFRLGVGIRSVPLYVYKTAESFTDTMTKHIRMTLQEGLFGWRVPDCIVTMIDCNYYVGDGRRRNARSAQLQVSVGLTTAADFRKLTPMVLMHALERAGTVVCEPMVKVNIEIPSETVGAVLPAVARLGGIAETSSLQGDLTTIETAMPAARAQDLQRQLSGLTGGEGVMEHSFGGYRPVSGAPPTRVRTTANPLNRTEYLMRLAQRATGPTQPH
jgi:ribosomal protection tetracycline resistance protein